MSRRDEVAVTGVRSATLLVFAMNIGIRIVVTHTYKQIPSQRAVSGHMFIIDVEHLVVRARLADKPPTAPTRGSDSRRAAFATVGG